MNRPPGFGATWRNSGRQPGDGRQLDHCFYMWPHARLNYGARPPARWSRPTRNPVAGAQGHCGSLDAHGATLPVCPPRWPCAASSPGSVRARSCWRRAAPSPTVPRRQRKSGLRWLRPRATGVLPGRRIRPGASRSCRRPGYLRPITLRGSGAGLRQRSRAGVVGHAEPAGRSRALLTPLASPATADRPPALHTWPVRYHAVAHLVLERCRLRAFPAPVSCCAAMPGAA
jgi:hypothetical protein